MKNKSSYNGGDKMEPWGIILIIAGIIIIIISAILKLLGFSIVDILKKLANSVMKKLANSVMSFFSRKAKKPSNNSHSLTSQHNTQRLSDGEIQAVRIFKEIANMNDQVNIKLAKYKK